MFSALNCGGIEVKFVNGFEVIQKTKIVANYTPFFKPEEEKQTLLFQWRL